MNIHRPLIGIVCSLAIGAGCSAGKAQALQTGGGGPQGFDQGSDDPPHVFTPRQHPPRVHPGPPPPDINLGGVPNELIWDGSITCKPPPDFGP